MSQRPIIFFDTEFSSFEDPRLISLGMATASGTCCHIALEPTPATWQPAACSPFVRRVVLPLLDTPPVSPHAARDEALAFLRAQISLAGPPLLVTDFTGDWVLLRGLLDPLPEDLLGVEAQLFSTPLIDRFPWNGRRHNALVDAQALCWAWHEAVADAR